MTLVMMALSLDPHVFMDALTCCPPWPCLLLQGDCETAIVVGVNPGFHKDFHLSLQACGVRTYSSQNLAVLS